GCWKVFSAMMCFGKEFAVTWRRTCIKHHDNGLVECAFRGFRETGWRNRSRLDRATRISRRESETRASRQRLAHAGTLYRQFYKCSAARMENSANVCGSRPVRRSFSEGRRNSCDTVDEQEVRLHPRHSS